MLTFQYAKNPSFASEDKSIISLTVKFAEYNEELPFGATNYDTYEYGRNIYQRALAGEFGEVGAFAAPSVEASPNQPQTTGSQTL
jgi:hypothetical protein